jgi:protein-L-isoaspartate(D-aspartate) O-methyltransferase
MKKEWLFSELKDYGIGKKVLEAMERVPRENFVLPENRKHAYDNYPLTIHEGQTISQPLTVALMTQWLDVCEGHKVLEVGAGSGYQAAVLAELAGIEGKIITCEVRQKLYEFAKKNLESYKNVEVLHANAMKKNFGIKFDRIIITASASEMPEKLLEHLKEGGKMILPVGDEMWLVEKTAKGVKKEMKGYFSFVPLVE